ncbi:VirD4-like conjugal transfer protein, CD1115 family [Dysosmobacter sp.]|uniref:VirD4-like conjugal transfer protein, CD1115 family n=1 Tax=Dysosmobacter sp. TaxID=2591382 RepID=UPI003AB84AAD
MGENLAITSKDYLSLYGESNLLKSLILYVDLDSTRTPEERNLAAVYQMLTQHTEKELTMLFDRLPIGHPAKGPYSLFSQASDTVRAGIVLGLGTRLQVLQSEAVRRITRSSDIDLSEPGWSKCAYYIILDDQNSSLEFLSALFFAFLFIKLVRYADSTPEQRCKVPVNIILDEMNNIGTIKDFGRRLSTIRSRALQVIMCSQSLPQLQNRYPNNLWAELLGNADTQIMLGATDDVTAEYFSARSGDMTVEVNSTMTTRQSLALAQVIPQYRYTEGIGRRRVLTPDEVLRLPNDELLIILRGQKVLRAKKFDFTEHPYAKECERTSIQRYQTDPAPAQPPEPPAQSMPAEPDMDKPPGPAPAAAAKPPVKAKPPQAKPKAPVPKSPSSGGQPSELPAKPAKRPKTLYESSRPPADF